MEAQIRVEMPAQVAPEKVSTPGMLVWRRLKKNRLAVWGMYILMFIIIASVAGPWLSP